MGTARFPANGTTYEEAVHYLTQRAVQSLMDGFRPEHPLQRLVEEGVEWGVRGTAIAADGARYQSVYVYAQGRGQGRLSRYVRTRPTNRVPREHPSLIGAHCPRLRAPQRRWLVATSSVR